MRASIRVCLATLAFLTSVSLGASAWAEYLVMEAGLRFPDRLGSVTLWKGDRYPQAALGHGVEYRAPGFAGSVYVYDGGNPNIPDGTANNIVRAQFTQARNDIFAIQRQRNLPDPQLITERPIRAGNIEFLAASYRFVRNDVDSVSLVALTGFRRHFVKLRVSVPAASGAAGTAQIDEFVQSVARLLADAGTR